MIRATSRVGWYSKAVLGVMTISLVGLLALCTNASSQYDAHTEFLLGQRLVEEGMFSLAAVQFQKFLDTFPDDPNCDKAQYGLGMSFWYLGDYKRAAAAFEILPERYPESEWVDDSLFQLGESFFMLQDYDRAIFTYQKLTKEYPQSNLIVHSLYSWASAHGKQKGYDDVLEALKELRHEFPQLMQTSQVQYIIAKTFYEHKRYPEAINEYSAFISACPTSKYLPRAYLERGLAYLADGEYSKARNDFVIVGTFLEKPEIESVGPPEGRAAWSEILAYEKDRPRLKESVGERGILRSVEPEYPAWAEVSGVHGEVELSFWVNPAGKVSEVEVWKTSGWPEFDNSASQALRKWKFVPIEGEEKQWGIFCFVFEFD